MFPRAVQSVCARSICFQASHSDDCHAGPVRNGAACRFTHALDVICAASVRCTHRRYCSDSRKAKTTVTGMASQSHDLQAGFPSDPPIWSSFSSSIQHVLDSLHMICRAGCGLIQPLLPKACSSSRLLSPAALASSKVHPQRLQNSRLPCSIDAASPHRKAPMPSCVADWTDTFRTLAGPAPRPQLCYLFSTAPSTAARQAPAQPPVQAHHRNGAT